MFSSSYPTLQVFIAMVLSMALTMIAMPVWIKILKHKEIGQQIRADGPQRHLTKQGTPTMGGVVMLLAITVSSLVLAVFSKHINMVSLILVLAAMLLSGALGFIDDMTKVFKQRSLGLTPKMKLICQIAISVIFCLIAVNYCNIDPTIDFPLIGKINLGVLAINIPFSSFVFSIPWLYIIFVTLLIAGMSNSVNLTDGLDGLAGGCVLIVMLVMAAVAFLTNSLSIALFCGATSGACIGFLWFNTYPALIFMGDTGSLALGTVVGAVAVMTKIEVVGLVLGGIFVAEALSVIIQVAVFKRTGKRVFLMAPFHHHLEQKGWSESQVVTRLMIVTSLLACVGFAWYFMGL